MVMIPLSPYSLPQKKVYTFVEPSTQNGGGLDEKQEVRQTHQLKGGCGAYPIFPLAPLILSTWLCRKCIFSFGGDFKTPSGYIWITTVLLEWIVGSRGCMDIFFPSKLYEYFYFPRMWHHPFILHCLHNQFQKMFQIYNLFTSSQWCHWLGAVHIIM